MPGKVPPANQFKHLPDLQRKTPDDPFSLFYFSLDWYPTLELKVGARTDWANAWTLPPNASWVHFTSIVFSAVCNVWGLSAVGTTVGVYCNINFKSIYFFLQ